MIFGPSSPRINELKNAINKQIPYEIFPNSVINVTANHFFTQQLHFIINRNLWGIFHLGSTDLIHHNDFVKQLTDGLGFKKKPILKHVYASNKDRYIAVLPKYNKLPKHLSYNCTEVVKNSCKKNTNKK